MNFRQSKPEDAEYIKENALYPHQLDKEDEIVQTFFSYTFEHDNIIFGSGGFQILTDTTAQCYVQFTKFTQDPVIPNFCTLAECIRRIKEYMEIFCNTHHILRLQAWVDVSFEEGKNLAQHLGFHKESKMINYLGQGKDAWLYVKMIGD